MSGLGILDPIVNAYIYICVYKQLNSVISSVFCTNSHLRDSHDTVTVCVPVVRL